MARIVPLTPETCVACNKRPATHRVQFHNGSFWVFKYCQPCAAQFALECHDHPKLELVARSQKS